MPTIDTRFACHKVRGVVFLFSIFTILFSAPTAAPQSSSKPVVAPDLAQRLAKFKPVKMPFDSSHLTVRERKMVEKLVDAAGLLDCIYWRQSDPEGLKLYLSLAGSKDPKDQMLREYLKINGGRFDLIDDNKPFVGTDPAPPGRGFFRPQETRANLEQRISSGRFEKSDVYSPYTIEKICAIGTDAEYWGPCFDPYHAAFGDFVNPMADDLREAAALSDDPAFANFLRLRADALLTDDYYKSDLAWMDLENPKFDVVFAPYEIYLDGLLGVKTSYGASIMIRNEEESRKLAVFQKYVPDLQESLPLAPEDRPSARGKRSPMEVVDAIYRAGDLLHGYQAVADNLPNDPRIHEEKGSKKIFWKNFMDARVNYVIVPIAKRLMRPDQAALVTGDGTLEFIIMHEISHGLGPSYVHGSNGKTDIREAIGPQYSSLEEAKADITGMLCMQWLIDHGAVPKEKQEEIDASFLGDGFRTIRFGIAEAHGQAAMMEFNYLVERGAIRRDAATGLYDIDFAKFPGAIASLAKELLDQEATGDRARAENWFKKYAVMPPELSAAFAKNSDIPVDVDPDFDFHPPVR
ncbi:MAG: Zn-dependent hydrolase [Acidobacteriia bacterium]|nr:Zn-dependent hydrolase [Terriglobia bacterium]